MASTLYWRLAPQYFRYRQIAKIEELLGGVEAENPVSPIWTESQFVRHVDSFWRHVNAGEPSGTVLDTMLFEEEIAEVYQGSPKEILSVGHINEFVNERWHFGPHVNIVGGGDAAPKTVQQDMRTFVSTFVAADDYETHSLQFNSEKSKFILRSYLTFSHITHTFYNPVLMFK